MKEPSIEYVQEAILLFAQRPLPDVQYEVACLFAERAALKAEYERLEAAWNTQVGVMPWMRAAFGEDKPNVD